MPRKQSSSRISTLAAKIMAETEGISPRATVWAVESFCQISICSLAELRSLCASLVSQDETKGQKPTKPTPKRASKRSGRKR